MSGTRSAMNIHRVTLKERAPEEGYANVMEYLASLVHEDVVTALCDEWCQVEPDGRCSHRCPSPLIAAGVI